MFAPPPIALSVMFKSSFRLAVYMAAWVVLRESSANARSFERFAELSPPLFRVRDRTPPGVPEGRAGVNGSFIYY